MILMRLISMAVRDELVVAIAERYGDSLRGEKARILDEFVAVSGYHRKHAMRLLREGRTGKRSGPRQARRVYDEAVREALVVLWEASDRICGKRLKPLWSQSLLAQILNHVGRAEEAEAKFAQVLSLQEVHPSLGPNHPDTRLTIERSNAIRHPKEIVIEASPRVL